VSPILIRPVREQLEHDRLIRFLQSKYQKKFEVVANVGDAQLGPVKLSRPAPFFPDLVLLSGGKIAGLVEVETGESTNNLEAMAQWQHFGRARVPFYLYVPVAMFDAAKRFCDAYQVSVTEIWTYRGLYEGFDLVRMVHNPSAVANAPKATSVVGKLLPPVTPVHVEPEKEAKILELTNLVEMANRQFRAAQGRSGTAAAARAAAKAAAKAAAAKTVVPAVAAKPAEAPAAKSVAKPAPAAASSKAAPVKAAPVKAVPPVKVAAAATAKAPKVVAKPVKATKAAVKKAPSAKVPKKAAIPTMARSTKAPVKSKKPAPLSTNAKKPNAKKKNAKKTKKAAGKKR